MLAQRALMAAAGSGGLLDFAFNAPDATVLHAYRAEDYTAGNWPDRVGSADLTQGTGSLQPSAVSDGGADFNNKPIVRFDGSDDFLDASIGTIAQPFWEVHIAKTTLDNSSVKNMSSTTSGQADVAFDSGENALLAAGSSLGGTSGSLLNSTNLIAGLFNGASSELRIDGAVTDSGNAGSNSKTGLRLGKSQSGGNIWGGDCAESIVGSGGLSSADHSYLINYVNQRYGFSIAEIKESFTSNDTWTVPAGVTSATFKVWGAGGVSGSADSDGDWAGGGSGGYVEFTLAVSESQEFTVVIGAGGTASPNDGGGLTGVHNGNGFASESDVYGIAGAGGAAGGPNTLISSGRGGLGGGAGKAGGEGQSSGGQGGNPGTSSVGTGGAGTSSNGANGSGNSGGAPTSPSTDGGGGGGGGDGRKGGGAGGVDTAASGGGGGGGGSNFITGSATDTTDLDGNNGGNNAGGAAVVPTDRPAGTGAGGQSEGGAGQRGAIVVVYSI